MNKQTILLLALCSALCNKVACDRKFVYGTEKITENACFETQSFEELMADIYGVFKTETDALNCTVNVVGYAFQNDTYYRYLLQSFSSIDGVIQVSYPQQFAFVHICNLGVNPFTVSYNYSYSTTIYLLPSTFPPAIVIALIIVIYTVASMELFILLGCCFKKVGDEKRAVDVWFLWLFFGFLGMHRFYLNKKWTALVYFFTFGVCGVGWIVDAFLYV